MRLIGSCPRYLKNLWLCTIGTPRLGCVLTNAIFGWGWLWSEELCRSSDITLMLNHLLLSKTTYIHTLFTQGGPWGYPYSKFSPYSWPTQPQKRLAKPLGSTSLSLFEKWCGFLYVRQKPEKWKCWETGSTVYRPHLRRLKIAKVIISRWAFGSQPSAVIACVLNKNAVSWQTRYNKKLLKLKLSQNAKHLPCLLKFGLIEGNVTVFQRPWNSESGWP